MIRFQVKPAFTLIEMLIASSIFAIIVVISAGIFGSSAKTQLNTQAAIHNQELATNINDKIFDDLKSSTDWGKVTCLRDQVTPRRIFRIKGIAFLELTTTANLKLPTISEENVPDALITPNLIIGFSGPETATVVTIYYFRNNRLYRTVKTVNFADIKSLTADQLMSAEFDLINPNKEIKTDKSVIKNFSIWGKNYISNPEPGDRSRLSPLANVQPLINLNLMVADKSSGSIIMETKTSVSSRNYVEEIN